VEKCGLDSSGSEERPVAGSCEDGGEPSDFKTKKKKKKKNGGGEFDWLSDN
jgi:hypothetical protein